MQKHSDTLDNQTGKDITRLLLKLWGVDPVSLQEHMAVVDQPHKALLSLSLCEVRVEGLVHQGIAGLPIDVESGGRHRSRGA